MTSVADTSAVLRQPRASADRCPGLLRPHRAEDGLLVRLRVPGGQTTTATLLELGRISAEFGEGSVQLTSRGNLQLRGLDEARLTALVERVSEAGLLPSVTHERVRNIVASPLTGLDPERPDLRPMIAALDIALCAAPELAELPRRFLFAVDDGRGDLLSLRFDLAFIAHDQTTGTVLVGDGLLGITTARLDPRRLDAGWSDAVELLVQLAIAFVRLRRTLEPRPWHLAELPQLRDLDRRLQPVRDLSNGSQLSPGLVSPAGPVPLGAVAGAASVSVALSLLDRQQIEAVDRAAGGGPVVITPWRGLVIPGAASALRALAEAGLVVEESSAWSRLTACIGAPGCARSAISTRQLASELVEALDDAAPQAIHLSGCERRCGAPATAHVDLVAPGSLDRALALIGRTR